MKRQRSGQAGSPKRLCQGTPYQTNIIQQQPQMDQWQQPWQPNHYQYTGFPPHQLPQQLNLNQYHGPHMNSGANAFMPMPPNSMIADYSDQPAFPPQAFPQAQLSTPRFSTPHLRRFNAAVDMPLQGNNLSFLDQYDGSLSFPPHHPQAPMEALYGASQPLTHVQGQLQFQMAQPLRTLEASRVDADMPRAPVSATNVVPIQASLTTRGDVQIGNHAQNQNIRPFDYPQTISPRDLVRTAQPRQNPPPPAPQITHEANNNSNNHNHNMVTANKTRKPSTKAPIFPALAPARAITRGPTPMATPSPRSLALEPAAARQQSPPEAPQPQPLVNTGMQTPGKSPDKFSEAEIVVVEQEPQNKNKITPGLEVEVDVEVEATPAPPAPADPKSPTPAPSPPPAEKQTPSPAPEAPEPTGPSAPSAAEVAAADKASKEYFEWPGAPSEYPAECHANLRLPGCQFRAHAICIGTPRLGYPYAYPYPSQLCPRLPQSQLPQPRPPAHIQDQNHHAQGQNHHTQGQNQAPRPEPRKLVYATRASAGNNNNNHNDGNDRASGVVFRLVPSGASPGDVDAAPQIAFVDVRLNANFEGMCELDVRRWTRYLLAAVPGVDDAVTMWVGR
ncbi:hypothetical protein F4777DRAFT_599231 [Nemania sp. FL0916]|nr:hypothetical protein F4777DRAFT_599231 [Nemania sp. FL0916]